jgi:hypothetical protein
VDAVEELAEIVGLAVGKVVCTPFLLAVLFDHQPSWRSGKMASGHDATTHDTPPS